MELEGKAKPGHERCSFCDGALDGALFAGVRDRLGISLATWTFRRCQNCQSAILHPMPNQDELLAAYPPTYHVEEVPLTDGLRRLHAFLERHLFYLPVIRYSVKAVQRVTGLRAGQLLDVGGGSGHRGKLFQQAGFDVTLVDADKRALDKAEELFGLRTVCGLLEQAELPLNRYDLVTFWYVVEHLLEPQKTLAAAAHLLRPGGWLVALVPLVDSWQAAFFREHWCAVTEAPRHTGLPSQKGMECLLAKSGLIFRYLLRTSLLDSAGSFGLSLIPQSTTPIACAGESLAIRLWWRSLGMVASLPGLCLSWLESFFHHPSAGIFFAQKPIV